MTTTAPSREAAGTRAGTPRHKPTVLRPLDELQATEDPQLEPAGRR